MSPIYQAAKLLHYLISYTKKKKGTICEVCDEEVTENVLRLCRLVEGHLNFFKI